MNNFKLQPADILVNVNSGDDPWSRIRRWGLGSPYTHVFIYLGNMRLYTGSLKLLKVPLLFESNGRGVCLRLLSERFGQNVAVMRLEEECDKIPYIIREAIKLASDDQSRYDYTCIPAHIIPRILHEKLGMPVALKYQRNEQMVCSEACCECFWRAGILVLPQNAIPFPGDFVELSGILTEVNRGKLSPEWVV